MRDCAADVRNYDGVTMLIWTCPNCRFKAPVSVEEFPVHCRCRFVETLAEFQRRVADPQNWTLPPPLPPPPPPGIGAIFAALLKGWGIFAVTGCGCADLRREMDAAGPEKVAAEIDYYAGRIRQNAEQIGWVTTLAALVTRAGPNMLDARFRRVALAAASSPLSLFDAAIREAIRIACEMALTVL